MKANGVPEKLYIDLFKGEFNVSYSPTNNSVEYTRTDAFIEKACEWLSKHAIKYYFDSSKFLGTDELVEDFKIAMTL